MVLVDNAVYSFGFQLNNGIPISPYYSSVINVGDEELIHLAYYFSCIVHSQDVRM